MSKFREVLKNRNFFFLWLGQIISQLGDRLGQMALIGLVYLRAPGSTIEVAKILSFTIIPVFLIGPIAGVYVDRWDRRRTLYISDFLRTILVLVIPMFLFYSRSLAPTYLLIFVIFCISRFYVPAKLSILPELVEAKDLLLANSLVNITGMIAAIIGFGVSGLLVEWLGPRSGLYLDSLSFLISGSLVFLISTKVNTLVSFKKVSHEIVEVIRKSVLAEVKDGALYFIKNKDIRFTAWITFILWSALGAIYVVLIVFVQNTLHSATKDLGLLIMFLGIGLFLGSVIYGRFGSRLSHYKMIFISLILSGIMLAVIVATLYYYPYFLTAAAMFLLLGFLIAPIIIASNTIIHSASTGNMLGKVFSSFEIIMHLGFLLFMFITSILAEKFSHNLILIIVSLVVCLVGAVNLICHRKITWLN